MMGTYEVGKLDEVGQYLANEFSLKKATITKYRTKLAAMEEMLKRPPPYSTKDVSRYLTHLYLNKSGKSSGDTVRQALDWWHQTNNQTPPCNASTKRLCDAMHRELPNSGNPPRRPLEPEEKNLLIRLAISRIREPGDHWDRNATILALDFATGLRIQDLLRIRFEHLTFAYHPLRLKIWITDGKKDLFSVGKMSIEYTRVVEDPYDGILKLWEFTQNSNYLSENTYIFKSTRSNAHHITYDYMRDILLELAKTLNLPEQELIGWHSCRKTRADQEFDQTEGDLPSVRHILGHTAKSKSTKLYLSRRPAPKS